MFSLSIAGKDFVVINTVKCATELLGAILMPDKLSDDSNDHHLVTPQIADRAFTATGHA